MDNSYHNVSAIPQSQFLYYTPDIRHSGFSQDHHGNLSAPIYHPHMSQSLQSTSTFSPSEIPNPNMPPSHMYHCGYTRETRNLASPSSVYHTNNFLPTNLSSNLLVDTKAQEPELYYYPSTPPLSASRSITSSPPDLNCLPTPVNAAFTGVTRVKDENMAENYNTRNWTNSTSPPVTPAFIQPNSLTSNGSTNDILSAVQCSLLSPSPSPFPHHSLFSDGDFDFCDPRQITMVPVSQTNSTSSKSNLSQSLPLVPAFCVDEKENHKHISEAQDVNNIVDPHIISYPVLPHQPHPTFGQISLLDNDEDYANTLADYSLNDSILYFGSKRQRVGSGCELSIQSESMLSADELQRFKETEDIVQVKAPCPLSPPCSGSEREIKKGKRVKKTKRSTQNALAFEINYARSVKTFAKMKADDTESNSGSVCSENSKVASSQTEPQDKKKKGETQSDVKHHQAPVTRRGRKQSTTEDPSKTFVCELCPQRFRRQEHLKRHFRSLHTEDRPFECHECGKKFSRSDNLSQHARTHGSGAIIMGLIEDNELQNEADADHERMKSLGSILYHAAAATSGSETGRSSNSINSGDDSQTYKKRKRPE